MAMAPARAASLLGLFLYPCATGDTMYQQPQQIHIGLGMSPHEMTVQWTTIQAAGTQGPPHYDPGDSFVAYGRSPTALTSVTEGYSFLFRDFGKERRQYTMHIAKMVNLKPSTSYCYIVGGNSSGWSSPFCFKSAPGADLPSRLPMTYAVYGDQGDYNGQTIPSLQAAVRQGELDMVVHVGDMAYDMDSDNGRNGDAWMNDIQPIAASVPYMVCPGNHEGNQNYNHYTQRFRNMPSNSGNISMPEFGSVPNNWWYSWDSGLVHFASLSTEIYFENYGQQHLELLGQQYAWLEADLKAVDRAKTPWLVVYGHRPMYCSCDGDCDGEATANRQGIQQLDGTFKYGLEALFYKYGVDLYLAGHEHDYERMFDVAPKFNPQTPWLSGVSTHSTVDPPATTYIVTGSAGNVEDHETFTRPKPDRSAKRLNTYGWSKMVVYNATHILWQQVQTDVGEPPETWGQVVDEAWIVQRHHGAFPHHPRRHELESGTSQPAEPVAFVDNRTVIGSARSGRCRKAKKGKLPVCGDDELSDGITRQGVWQATKSKSAALHFV